MAGDPSILPKRGGRKPRSRGPAIAYEKDPDLALRRHALGVAAIYVGSDAPELPTEFPALSLAWDTIVARAIASDDDHDAKFVFACSEEARVSGGELCRNAAARRVG